MDLTGQIKKAKSGDQEALIQLVMERKKEYYGLAYTLLQDQEDSLDAMQDMIVILAQNIKKLRKEEAFPSWSKTILVNCCRGILKKRKTVNYTDIHDYAAHEDQSSAENFKRSEERQDILQELKKLNPRQQEAIKLRFFLDLEYEKIAELTRTPLGTVKSRIASGLAKLKAAFGGEY